MAWGVVAVGGRICTQVRAPQAQVMGANSQPGPKLRDGPPNQTLNLGAEVPHRLVPRVADLLKGVPAGDVVAEHHPVCTPVAWG